MDLTLAAFPVHRAEFGEPAVWTDGVLTVEPAAIRRLVLSDPRIGEVRLELAHPGDSLRVLRALDAVEPLGKVAGPSSVFPGFLGPPDTCGRGRTHRLDGFTVVAVTEFPFPAAGVQAFEEGIIEMSGPGGAYGGCADRVNLVLVLAPGAVASNVDYDDAVRPCASRKPWPRSRGISPRRGWSALPWARGGRTCFAWCGSIRCGLRARWCKPFSTDTS
jgi:glycine reductase